MRFKKSLHENHVSRPFVVGSILLLLLGLVISPISNTFLLIFIALLFVVIYVIGRFYEKHVDDFLEIDTARTQQRMDPGDEGEIEIVIRQKGILPLLLATLSLELDDAIELASGKTHRRRNRTFIERPFSLLFWEEKKIRLPFTAKHRGISKIRSLEISVTNPFNLNRIYLTVENINLLEVLVYPEQSVFPGMDEIKPKGKGEHPTRQSLYIDRTRTISTRPYMAGDPFNRIHWKASAKEGDLQVKVDENVGHISWMFILNIKVHRNDEEAFEEMIKKLTYMVYVAAREGIAYSFFINIPSLNQAPYIHLSEGIGRKQLGTTLELLARVEGGTFTIPYERLLGIILRKEQIPTDVIFVETADQLDSMHAQLFERKGARVHHLDAEGLTRKGAIRHGTLA